MVLLGLRLAHPATPITNFRIVQPPQTTLSLTFFTVCTFPFSSILLPSQSISGTKCIDGNQSRRRSSKRDAPAPTQHPAGCQPPVTAQYAPNCQSTTPDQLSPSIFTDRCLLKQNRWQSFVSKYCNVYHSACLSYFKLCGCRCNMMCKRLDILSVIEYFRHFISSSSQCRLLLLSSRVFELCTFCPRLYILDKYWPRFLRRF